MRIRTPLMMAMVVAALAAVLAGCGGAGSSNAPEQKIDLQMGPGMTFNPAKITVKVGQPVSISARNTDVVLHDWNIQKIAVSGKKEKSDGAHSMGGGGKEPDLHMSLKAGGSGSVSFTPKAAGTYEFYCAEPGHKDAGMKGTLVVE